jgi:hypothetical protein
MNTRKQKIDSSNEEPCPLTLGTYHILACVLERVQYWSVEHTEKFGAVVDFDNLTKLCQHVLKQQAPGFTGKLSRHYVEALWHMMPTLVDAKLDAIRLASACESEFRVWR